MFSEAPRYIGMPHQYFVPTQEIFSNFESMFKDKVPFMVSTYEFVNEMTPIFDNLFFDIDSYFSIRIPYRNTRKLVGFFERRNVPFIINFSGGKGFHIFAIFKKQKIESEKTKEKIKDLMYSVQKYVTSKTGIEAYDDPTLGRLRFLVRYPTSKYIRPDNQGNMEWNTNYCRNIPIDDFYKGMKHIAKLVKEPGEVPKRPRATMTLSQFAHSLDGFKIVQRNNGIKFNPHKFMGKPHETIVPNVSAIGVPCLKEIAVHKHPTHFERIELVAWLKHMNYTDIAINAFIKALNWTDYNYKTTSYQISKIRARYPSCTKLREWGYDHNCKHCTLFRRKKW